MALAQAEGGQRQLPPCEPSCKARGWSRTQHSPHRLCRGRTHRESCRGARAELKRHNFVLTSFWWISIKSGINLFKTSDPREAVRVMEATGAGLRFTLPQSPPWLGNKSCSSFRHVFHSSLLLSLHQQHQEAKPVSDNVSFFRKVYFHCKQTDLH